jgi:hypothetical protein
MGGIVFRVQEDLEPLPPREVWRTTSIMEYSILRDGIFEEGIKIYQWPRSDNLSWKVSPNIDRYIVVNYLGKVDTPYTTLKGCYRFTFATNPDTSVDTFCPGIGFVEHSYTHHGTVQIEHFALILFNPGK